MKKTIVILSMILSFGLIQAQDNVKPNILIIMVDNSILVSPSLRLP